MDELLQRKQQYSSCVAAMAAALAHDDEAAFRNALSGFDSLRESEVLTAVRRVTGDLRSALEQFHMESRLVELAQRQVPDARHRLAHVLRLTDDAAHRTMDLVEQCYPLADGIAQQAEQLLGARPAADTAVQAFLGHAATGMTTVRGKLAELLLVQGYQDLSGQIIRGVMTLVDELEEALRDLVRIAGVEESPTMASEEAAHGFGPVVPGVNDVGAVHGQQDVDALLSDLGM